MLTNVIQLPRPVSARSPRARLGHFLRIGHNDHRQVRDLLAEGERGYQGIVVDAPHAGRHNELFAAAQRLDIDLILDPKTQSSALPGGFTETTAALPWGIPDRPHTISDFEGDAGKVRCEQIAELACTKGFSEVLAPTHILQAHDDPWLAVDVANAGRMRKLLPSACPLIYSLAIPIALLRDPSKRRTVVDRLSDAPFDAIWIKVENFGANETGAKTVDCIEAFSDFHSLQVPVIADHVAGLPALALLAFGAAGGTTHGVMTMESFTAAHLRRARQSGGNGGIGRRIRVPSLGLLLSPEEAEALVKFNSRTPGHFGCRDPNCCPRLTDMFQQPVRHYLRQRAREIDALDAIPQDARPASYVESVRRVSDAIARAASLGIPNNRLSLKLHDQQARLGRFRGVIAHFAESREVKTIAQLPQTRAQREGRG
jgi:hypothetical protein